MKSEVLTVAKNHTAAHKHLHNRLGTKPQGSPDSQYNGNEEVLFQIFKINSAI